MPAAGGLHDRGIKVGITRPMTAIIAKAARVLAANRNGAQGANRPRLPGSGQLPSTDRADRENGSGSRGLCGFPGSGARPLRSSLPEAVRNATVASAGGFQLYQDNDPLDANSDCIVPSPDGTCSSRDRGRVSKSLH